MCPFLLPSSCGRRVVIGVCLPLLAREMRDTAHSIQEGGWRRAGGWRGVYFGHVGAKKLPRENESELRRR